MALLVSKFAIHLLLDAVRPYGPTTALPVCAANANSFQTPLLENFSMFTYLIAGSFLGFGLLFVAAADPKPADCCTAKLACCKEGSACCKADAKLGCCEKGLKCCAENKDCCAAPQKCCTEGSDCCKEAKACCGPAKVAPKAPITEAKGCCGPVKVEAKSAHCGDAAKACCAPSIKKAE